jgi:hypothetical protein
MIVVLELMACLVIMLELWLMDAVLLTAELLSFDLCLLELSLGSAECLFLRPISDSH